MIPASSPDHSLQREVAARLGLVPGLFRVGAAPGALQELWSFATVAWLDSPLPSLFKERLFVYLSRFGTADYCLVRHAGFLLGKGRPAGDAEAVPETPGQVAELLRTAVPAGPELARSIARLEAHLRPVPLPASGTQAEADLFAALGIMFVERRHAGRAREAVRRAVGVPVLELLTAYLAYIRNEHRWCEAHPELATDPDMIELLARHKELARLLAPAARRDAPSPAEVLRESLLGQQLHEHPDSVALTIDVTEWERLEDQLRDVEARLRDVVSRNALAEAALHASEIRAGFLQQIATALCDARSAGEALEAAAWMLGEHLDASAAGYGEALDDHTMVVMHDWVGTGGVTCVGRHSLANLGIASHMLAGRTLRIGDTQRETVTHTPGSAALCDALRIRALVAVPLRGEGRPGGLLFVTAAQPRTWTDAEVRVIEDVAERTRATLERCVAERTQRAAELKYRTLFESIDQGLMVCEFVPDRDGNRIDCRIVALNPAWERLTGLSSTQSPGRCISELLPGEYAWWVRTLDDIERSGEPGRFDRAVESFGRSYRCQAFASGVDRVSVVLDDITRSRQPG